MSQAPQTGQIKLGEVRNIAVSFVGVLDAGENLTGTPTIAAVTGLAFASIGVSSAELTINGAAVPAARAVQFKVTPSAAGRYRILVTATSNASPAQTLIAELILQVTD